MRSLRQSVVHMKKQNLYLIGSVVCALFMTIAVIYIPVLSELFAFEHISVAEFAVALLMSVSIIPIVEIEKWIHRALQDVYKRQVRTNPVSRFPIWYQIHGCYTFYPH